MNNLIPGCGWQNYFDKCE